MSRLGEVDGWSPGRGSIKLMEDSKGLPDVELTSEPFSGLLVVVRRVLIAEWALCPVCGCRTL